MQAHNEDDYNDDDERFLCDVQCTSFIHACSSKQIVVIVIATCIIAYGIYAAAMVMALLVERKKDMRNSSLQRQTISIAIAKA